MRLLRAGRSLLFAAILVILMALVPRRAGRPESKEVAAVTQIRRIHTVQTQYFSEYGRYAGDLRELGISPFAIGYRFSVTGGGGGYAVSAIPERPDTHSRAFYSDQTMVVDER